jgi:cysteinyl-tRNA synthetase
MHYPNVLEAIGKTPLVAVRRLATWPGVRILAKLEMTNPGGSIKDRVALAMVEAAEASGELTPGKTVIEATSGNTGIGLAMVCAVKGYRLRLLMSESASVERRRILQAYGAEIRLTPGHMGTDGAIEEAYRLAREEPDKYVLMDQYNNPASIQAHYMGTGLEMWEQTGGELTHVVCTLGTSGTAMGITKRMREMNPAVRVVAVEPYAGHKIQGLKNMQESYPPGIYDKKALDRIAHVEDEAAFEMCRRLAREEGIFVGMSSGAAMAAAVDLAEKLAEEYRATGREALIVALLPDGGDRYLSTSLFAQDCGSGPCVRDEASGEPVRIDVSARPAGFFTMGPPLDDLAEPDAWRRIVLLDVLARFLRPEGAPDGGPGGGLGGGLGRDGGPAGAKVLVGLADMDDRAMEAARAAGAARAAFSERALAEIAATARRLGVSGAVEFRAASGAKDRALAVCRKLLAKGHAYEKLRSVYFDVLRFERYGGVSHMDMDKLSLGATVDLADYVKDNPKDFTLLKRASLADLKAGECLATEWGNVRPSWFLQLAATALEGLSGGVTLFMGSEAHRFPHMENFRALWALAGGVEPRAWLLCRALATGDDAPAFADLLRADEPVGPLRMWLLSTAYRKPLTLSARNLDMWRRNWLRVQNLAALLGEQGEPGETGKTGATAGKARAALSPDIEQALVNVKSGLKSALENDLSLHRFWPVLFTFCRDVQQRRGAGALSAFEAAACLTRLRAVDRVLGVLDASRLPVALSAAPAGVAELAAQRRAARAARDFARADALRDEIAAAGFRIEDTPTGERLYPLA